MTRPLRLEEMTPATARRMLADSRKLIIPAGTLEIRGPHLPLGTDTIILDHLADDLSAAIGVVRSPCIPFGVKGRGRRDGAGVATVSRKALHRVMNELIADWEEVAGVTETAVLTAHAAEAHQEALSTIRTAGSVRLVDIFSLDFTPVLGRATARTGELETYLIQHLRPELVEEIRSGRAQGDAQVGGELYTFILTQLPPLCFPA